MDALWSWDYGCRWKLLWRYYYFCMQRLNIGGSSHAENRITSRYSDDKMAWGIEKHQAQQHGVGDDQRGMPVTPYINRHYRDQGSSGGQKWCYCDCHEPKYETSYGYAVDHDRSTCSTKPWKRRTSIPLSPSLSVSLSLFLSQLSYPTTVLPAGLGRQDWVTARRGGSAPLWASFEERRDIGWWLWEPLRCPTAMYIYVRCDHAWPVWWASRLSNIKPSDQITYHYAYLSGTSLVYFPGAGL